LAARDRLINEKRKANPDLERRARRKWWKSRVSSLLRRSDTLHEGDDESDSSRSRKKKSEHRRVQPHMIRRTDEQPRPVNPSGWISQGGTSIPQASLVKSRSNGSKSPIRGQKPNSSFSQNSGSIHSQPSGQRPNDSEVESESELEDLNESPRHGRSTDLENCKFVLDRFVSTVDIAHSRPSPTSWSFRYSSPDYRVRPHSTVEESAPTETIQGSQSHTARCQGWWEPGGSCE